MDRRWTLLGIALSSFAVLFLASSAVGGAPGPLRKNTSSQIEALAMNGSRVAYDVSARFTSPRRRCNTVYVWNTATQATTAMSGKGTCNADVTSTGAGVRELKVAGLRVAWIVNQGGNSESDDYLYTSSLPRPKERKLGSAVRTGEVMGGLVCGGRHSAGLAGPWIGCLVGAGKFLAVNRWTTDESGHVTAARLQSIGANLRTIVSGSDSMDAVATDGKQVAVLRAGGGVALYTAGGQLLRTVTPTSPKEVALRGDYLVVLTTANRLEVYNSHSGKLLHTWRAAKGARYLDVSSKLVAYAAPLPGGWYLRAVHLLSLPTGKDRVLAKTSPQIVGVQLEPAGLVYAVNRTGSSGVGYLAFTPMNRLSG